MKHLFTLLFAVLAISAMAQPDKGSPEERKQVERLKIAFLTEELDLTVEESQQFWPVYNTFEDERAQQEKELRDTMRKLETSTPSDQEVKAAIATATRIRKELAEREQQYYTDVLAVLGPDKTVRLMRAEHRFKQVLIEKLRERRQQERQDQRPRGRQQP